MYLGHSCHSTNQNDIDNLTLADISILDSLFTWRNCSLHQFSYEALKLGAGELHVHVLWAGRIHCQEREVDVRLFGIFQSDHIFYVQHSGKIKINVTCIEDDSSIFAFSAVSRTL